MTNGDGKAPTTDGSGDVPPSAGPAPPEAAAAAADRSDRDDRPREDAFGRHRGPPPPRGGSGGGRGGRGGGRGGGPPRGRGQGGVPEDMIRFRSWEEERDFVEIRRRKRRERKSKFDVEPTPEQLERERMRELALVATSTAAGGIGAAAAAAARARSGGRINVSSQPQQTRHARRLYVGNIPEGLTDAQVHGFFHDAIAKAMGHASASDIDDPILSVYINPERRFAFIEFKTMEMTSACMEFDGINVMGRGKVKVKRPNDFNPALAPDMNPDALPKFDISRLGIVSTSVPDSPNKIFIGGLHYHLTEDQVLELLQAFGRVKAFNLVRQDPAATTNKGFGFVEYADPAVTHVAIMGLNGMDIGGGKQISAKGAAARGEPAAAAATTGGGVPMIMSQQPGAYPAVPASAAVAVPGAPAVVDGVDVNALLEAAMGGGTAPPPLPPPPPQHAAAVDVNQIANAALNAAFGPTPGAVPAAAAGMPPHIPPAPNSAAGGRTRILVLLNMVTDEDLATDDELNALMDEVGEECAKFGQLLSMKIPRAQDPNVNPSAVKKIFLEYAAVDDVIRAEAELVGRQFGPNVVQATYFPEDAYAAGQLY